MLRNMFVGDPPGNYDRLLDVSRAATGSLFFVPPAAFLDDVAAMAAPAAPSEAGDAPAESQTQSQPRPGGSLRIGSLKEEAGHE
jgi:putative iron-dependent peroxidase